MEKWGVEAAEVALLWQVSRLGSHSLGHTPGDGETAELSDECSRHFTSHIISCGQRSLRLVDRHLHFISSAPNQLTDHG